MTAAAGALQQDAKAVTKEAAQLSATKQSTVLSILVSFCAVDAHAARLVFSLLSKVMCPHLALRCAMQRRRRPQQYVSPHSCTYPSSAISWEAKDLVCGLCVDSAQHIVVIVTAVCLGVPVHTMLGASSRTCQDTWPAVSRASASCLLALLRLHSSQDLERLPSKCLQQPLSSFCVVSSSVMPLLSGWTPTWIQLHSLVGGLP